MGSQEKVASNGWLLEGAFVVVWQNRKFCCACANL